MALSDFRLVRERDQPLGAVLLACSDGAKTLMVSIPRADVNHFARQSLPPSDQNFLIEKNLETLAPIINRKYERGEIGDYSPMPAAARLGGAGVSLIALTSADLEEGLTRFSVSSQVSSPVEWVPQQGGSDNLRRHGPSLAARAQASSPTPSMATAAEQTAQQPRPYHTEYLGPRMSRAVAPGRPVWRVFLLFSDRVWQSDAWREAIDNAVNILLSTETPYVNVQVTIGTSSGFSEYSVKNNVDHLHRFDEIRELNQENLLLYPSLQMRDFITMSIMNALDLAEARRSGQQAPESAIAKLEALVADQGAAPALTAGNGRIDLAPTTADYEQLAPRIEAATVAIESLIGVCRRGNQQHGDLAEYAEQYRTELERLGPQEPGLRWFVVATRIETYRSNYAAVSKNDPGEYPPLEPGLSTLIDAVVLATGMLARLFPEIAKSQDDFERYSGRQVGVHRAQRELLDVTLSDLARSDGVLTSRAADATKAIAELDPGATPEDTPETARVVATKSGWLRGFFSTVAKLALDQVGHLRENIRTKGLYDLSKEVVKGISAVGFAGVLAWLANNQAILHSLAAQWPAMFDFLSPLLRLLGL